MKRTIHKIWSVALILILAFSLIACKSTNTSTAEWKQAEQVYRLYIQTPGSQPTPEFEEDLSNMFESLLKELEQKVHLFVAVSSNFDVLDGKKIYEHNKESMEGVGTHFDENIDPNGKCLTVSINYFTLNPIETVNGRSIKENLVADENTLNILVPEQYQSRQDEITALYRAHFYFEKVTVENIYNEDLARPLNTLQEEDLSVNIIYVKENQSYFTFNPKVVPETNNIIVDPMVIVYEFKTHASYAYAYAGQGSFFESEKDADAAFALIEPEIDKITGLSEYILGVRLASEHSRPFR